MPPDQKGKTLWDMLLARIRGGGGNGSGLAFFNPLDLRVGSAVPVAFANGVEFTSYDFGVQEIQELTRHLAGQDFRFTDYLLKGVDTKSFDANQSISARLRAVPNLAGGHDTLLLRLYDEFAFAEDFLAVLKDTTGVFEIAAEPPGPAETFLRINNLRDSYEAAILRVTATTADGKAAPGSALAAKLEYWDYSRDLDLGSGNTATEFLFIEMNPDTGWFQLWRGREFFS